MTETELWIPLLWFLSGLGFMAGTVYEDYKNYGVPKTFGQNAVMIICALLFAFFLGFCCFIIYYASRDSRKYNEMRKK